MFLIKKFNHTFYLNEFKKTWLKGYQVLIKAVLIKIYIMYIISHIFKNLY